MIDLVRAPLPIPWQTYRKRTISRQQFDVVPPEPRKELPRRINLVRREALSLTMKTVQALFVLFVSSFLLHPSSLIPRPGLVPTTAPNVPIMKSLD
jgi:hypothetical protein